MSSPGFHIAKIKTDAQTDNKLASKLCISLREWVILISLLIFIFTLLVTAAMVLGTIHTGKLLDLLHDDIKEEDKKHSDGGVRMNLVRLQESRQFIFVFNQILNVLMWIGWLNVACSAILIYGITTITPRYILPWILISMITNIFTLILAICANLDLITGFSITFPWLFTCIASSLLHVKLWAIIFVYYKILSKSKYATPSPIVIQAYGGYTHSIQPTIKPPTNDI